MLAGKGFSKVVNLTGGMRSWEDQRAFGPESFGMALFSGRENLEQVLIIAYSLEAGLQEFYTSLENQVQDGKMKALFHKLSAIEGKHQEHIFGQYQKIVPRSTSRQEFEQTVVVKAMEGGLTTEEYLGLYPIDFEVLEEVVSLAMGIEAQALDLYQRAAARFPQEEIRQTFVGIAEEERRHLQQLGKLLD